MFLLHSFLRSLLLSLILSDASFLLGIGPVGDNDLSIFIYGEMVQYFFFLQPLSLRPSQFPLMPSQLPLGPSQLSQRLSQAERFASSCCIAKLWYTIFRKKIAPPYVKVYLLIKMIQFDCSDDDYYFVWRPPAAITTAMRLGMLL